MGSGVSYILSYIRVKIATNHTLIVLILFIYSRSLFRYLCRSCDSNLVCLYLGMWVEMGVFDLIWLGIEI